MIDCSYTIEEKRLRQIKEYAYLHKVSVAKVVKMALDKFLKEERLKEIKCLRKNNLKIN